MARNLRSLFELTVIPAMVVLPVGAMILLQQRLVPPRGESDGKATKAISELHFNGFPYLTLQDGAFQSAHAVEAFTKLVEEKTAALGRNDAETLIHRNNLANALLADGRYVEAEASQRELLRDMETHLQAGHPDTFRCRFNLALNLRMQGKLPEARKEMETVYAGWKDVLGEGHPRTQSALLVLEKLRSPL